MFTIITLPDYATTASGLYPNSSALFTDLLPFMTAIIGVSLIAVFVPFVIDAIVSAFWRIYDPHDQRTYKEAMLRGIDQRERDDYNAKINQAFMQGYDPENKFSMNPRVGRKIIDLPAVNRERKRRLSGSYVHTSRGTIPIEDY